jgi:hypothetical protein
MLEVEVYDLLSLARIDLVHVIDQCQGILFLQSRLPGVQLRRRLDLGLRKKLLRLGAGLSPGAMVAPIDVSHGYSSFLRFCPRLRWCIAGPPDRPSDA